MYLCVCLFVCLSEVAKTLKAVKCTCLTIYCPVFLPLGCIRKPLHTETNGQTQETSRQGDYHSKYTCTQTVGTPALKQ